MLNNRNYSGFSGDSCLFQHKAIQYWHNSYRTLMPADGKAIFIRDWPLRGEMPATLDEIEQGVTYYQRHNLALVYGPACPIVCIDIDSKEHAIDLETLTVEALGATPLVSIGDYPKRKLLYRKAPGFNYPTKRFQPWMEVFASKGQTILEGIHPTTCKPYTWISQSPADTPVSELPGVTTRQLSILEEAFYGWLREKNITIVTKPGAGGSLTSYTPSWNSDEITAMREERSRCKLPHEFRECVIRHLKKMKPGTRHQIMTVTVNAMVNRGWGDDHIMSVLGKYYIQKFGDDRSLRTNKVVKAITSARRRRGLRCQTQCS